MTTKKHQDADIKKVQKAPEVAVGNSDKSWAAIISSIHSPLSMFALAVLITNTGFAAVAASFNSLTAFVYSMHLFLGIVGTFTIIALWDPRTLYHPKDSQDIDDALNIKRVSIKLAIMMLVLLLLVAYGLREYHK